jgi:cytochrome P450
MSFGQDRTAAWREWLAAGDVTTTGEGVYYINGADQVEAAAKNPEVFSSEGAYDLMGSPLPLVPIAFDPPRHTRFRRKLDKFFSPRNMAAREPQLRTELAALIDEIAAEGGTCEAMSRLAVPFPSTVFLSLFGLPLEDRDKFIGWKDAILQATDQGSGEPTDEVRAQAAELFGYLASYVGQRRENAGGTDLLGQLIADTDEGALTDEEILGLCFLFVIAGLDTVTGAVGFALSGLAADPALRDRVINDDHALATYIEEVLRVENPVPVAVRVTTQDVEMADVVIPEGSLCWLSLGTANRDPRRYRDAESIRIDEHQPTHFAFGRGPHRCLGSHLARLELRLVIEEWHRRIPNYSLAAEPQMSWPKGTLGWERLELKIG